ncbi:1259_t:CDS:2 [Ambispora leptoticha]|uniref:1259_t:CDS:1 n=1 Tax=Ambispora leptoticha TaxID=144679 RepID=A0A9N9FIV9_9GLOM|nr:1259_t:CDS:2 [Ambispora leptoticha]
MSKTKFIESPPKAGVKIIGSQLIPNLSTPQLTESSNASPNAAYNFYSNLVRYPRNMSKQQEAIEINDTCNSEVVMSLILAQFCATASP